MTHLFWSEKHPSKQAIDLVQINDEGVKSAARYVSYFFFPPKCWSDARPPYYGYLSANLKLIKFQQIKTRLLTDAYTPRTWRTHPLHICPVDSVEITDPRNKLVLDWIFLISSLNFSFWSEEKQENVFGVKWRDAWSSSDASNDAGKGKMQVWTGYWSLVAALDRGELWPWTTPVGK